MLSNNYLTPITDEAERHDPAYDLPAAAEPTFVPDIPLNVRVRRGRTGIWEASRAGVCVQTMDFNTLLESIRKMGWMA